MLYSLFIYQVKTGLLLWEKSFENDMDHKSELFSSFFSAIQSFLREMILQGTHHQDSKGLAGIDMGNFVVKITEIPNVNAELVILADKGDTKSLKKFTSRILKLLKAHEEIFREWNGDRSRFDVLDLEILEIISSCKNLAGTKSIIDGKNEILTEMMNKLPELKDDQKNHYRDEISFLDDRFKQSQNIFKKLEILNSKDIVLHKLKEKENIKSNRRLRQILMSELNSTKDKLSYYLTQTKESITKTVETGKGKSLYDLDFNQAYINLYSFSTKLKFVGNNAMSERYRTYAKILVDKPEGKKNEFSNVIREVLNLSNNIEDFLVKTSPQKD